MQLSSGKDKKITLISTKKKKILKFFVFKQENTFFCNQKKQFILMKSLVAFFEKKKKNQKESYTLPKIFTTEDPRGRDGSLFRHLLNECDIFGGAISKC